MEEEWVTAFAAYDAALAKFKTNLRSIAERLRAGEMPTEAELLREQEARTKVIAKLAAARRAAMVRFTGPLNDASQSSRLDVCPLTAAVPPMAVRD
jgi:hypothetical protein